MNYNLKAEAQCKYRLNVNISIYLLTNLGYLIFIFVWDIRSQEKKYSSMTP